MYGSSACLIDFHQLSHAYKSKAIPQPYSITSQQYPHIVSRKMAQFSQFDPRTYPRTVTVHPYPSPPFDDNNDQHTSYLYEYSSTPSRKENALVLIGGLDAGPHSLPYTQPLAFYFSAAPWAVFTVEIRSSHTGWGSGSLSRDVEDLRAVVTYLRETKGMKRVVLMGNSTGCQDCVAYSTSLSSGDRTGVDVDGYILQAPVSDRESLALEMNSSTIQKITDWAAARIKEGEGHDVVVPKSWLPDGMFRHGFVSAYRWYSLAAVGGDDDFFSSDLPPETVSRVWSQFDRPLLILVSEDDEHVPPHVNQGALLDKWKAACRPGIVSERSGLIPGADHEVSEPAEAIMWLANRVWSFLRLISGGMAAIE
ncbi:hypothetical protein QBC47DRAFT_331493 [Echria macrotheca]|uniref:Uncharacterized protein n=1 Tax=Echria macrotheca TaxID=438768 RepID=A0AAJ0B344_9PEZI|nr:hypothetical protein QBC47DRAFT_331493 [Echria macrotheca]